MNVLHVPTTVDAYIEEKKQPAASSAYLLLLYVRTYCTYLVVVYLLMYVLTDLQHVPGTRVPTDVRTHLLHVLTAVFLLKMHVRTHRTHCHVRTSRTVLL